MKKQFLSLIFPLFLLGNAGDLHAAKFKGLVLGLGYSNVFDHHAAPDIRLEYRPDHSIFTANLKPWIGLEVLAETSLLFGGGLLYDLPLNKRLTLTPSIGAALYAQGSSDLDLGYPIQLRTQLELSYAFDNGQNIGLYASHISNGGLDDHNPGNESVGLYWHTSF